MRAGEQEQYLRSKLGACSTSAAHALVFGAPPCLVRPGRRHANAEREHAVGSERYTASLNMLVIFHFSAPAAETKTQLSLLTPTMCCYLLKIAPWKLPLLFPKQNLLNAAPK